jgi:hypothetical protein
MRAYEALIDSISVRAFLILRYIPFPHPLLSSAFCSTGKNLRMTGKSM